MSNDLTKTLEDVERLSKGLPDAVLAHVGEFVVFVITSRTLAGIDANGDAFKPYVKAYANWRRRKTLRVTPPNLKVTGHMLGSIQHRKTGDNEITFGFQAPHEADKAQWNTGAGREWFDFKREDELALLEKEIADAFEAELGKSK